MQSTGINRDTKDQFYTKPQVANQCIDRWLEKITELSTSKSLLIEPSAGSGSFSDILHDKGFKVDCFDIDPKKEYITKKDFLTHDLSEYKKRTDVHCIGNPPFGRQSSLAKKFIKHCATVCDSISFILPKSFRKESFQKSFPLCFHLLHEIDLGENAFTINDKPYHVPCVFQIWIKMDQERTVEPPPIPVGFKFVKRPEIRDKDENGKPIQRRNEFSELPHFGILRAGGGDTCGRISLNYENGIACYREAWLFIKLDEQYDKDEFYKQYQLIDWKDDSNVGARSISKPTFIRKINQLLSGN